MRRSLLKSVETVIVHIIFNIKYICLYMCEYIYRYIVCEEVLYLVAFVRCATRHELGSHQLN